MMPKVESIEEAAAVIDRRFLDTPIVGNEALDRELGCRLALKVETLTPIRSFKGRGASWLMHRLGGQRQGGARLCLGRQFRPGVAYAARARSIPATVFAAVNASPVKIDADARLRAEVRLEGDDFDTAKAAARSFAASSGRVFVEDGAHPAIAEGAGTIARELDLAGALGDAILVPLGNGSLVNGIGAWIKARRPQVRVVAWQPPVRRRWSDPGARATDRDGGGRHHRRRRRGQGARSRGAGGDARDRRRGAAGGGSVRPGGDASGIPRTFGLVVEPARSSRLAAMLAAPQDFLGREVSTILCGGNLTAEQMRAWLLV